MAKKTLINPNQKNALGPVAREKYETILQARVRQCIAGQEAKLKAQRAKGLKIYLEQNKLADKLPKYRVALEELVAFFGEPDWRSPVWLRDDNSLSQQSKVQNGVDAILRGMKELKPVYAEIERLRRFESQVAEKVWLAGAPSYCQICYEMILTLQTMLTKWQGFFPCMDLRQALGIGSCLLTRSRGSHAREFRLPIA
jgi:hypothetical protein